MLSPEPMRHLSLVVLATEVEATTRAIAGVGVLHLLDVRQVMADVAAIRPYDSGEQLARLERLARQLDGLLEFLALALPTPDAIDETTEGLDERALVARADTFAAEVDALRNRLAKAQDNTAQLHALLRSLRALAPLGVPLEDVRRLRYAFLTSGLLPARNLARLRESVAPIVAMILPAGDTENGRILITALCLRADHEVLERALRSVQFERVDVPAHLAGTPDEGIAEITTQLAANQRGVAAIERERDALAKRLAPDLLALRARVARDQLLSQARALMGRSERTALITGWVPAVLVARLERAIHQAAGTRCALQWQAPDELEAVRRGRIPVPILLHNPVLIRPFERLLRSYGLPRYGELEPTAVVAVGFLTMFGFMFGDVGQGAVLFGIGYFIYRRMFRYRDYAVILMECGVFATAFGFLYGSVFGVERWLPALWLRPLEHMATLMQTAIGFGIAFLSIGLVLNLINAVRRRDLEALWERNGVLAALAYWTAAGLVIRRLTAGPEAVPIGTAMLWLALPMTLILLKEPVRAVAKGLREGQWPEPSEVFALVVRSAVEVLDTIVSTIANTATFIRLAAFALSHAGLFLATFSVADAVAKAGGGSFGAVAVVVLGNVVIIGLEGLIVSIQSVRLEYYEFFSKFYSGAGEEYRPLRFGSAPRV